MISVRLARTDDIPELVRLRGLLFQDLASTWGPAPTGDAWREACARALAQHLGDATMRIAVIDAATGLACCGIAIADQRLPTPFNPGGLIGHIFGIVTDPGHRRRGLAQAVMQHLLGWCDSVGLKRVDLNASPDGQRLYRQLGFTDHPGTTLSRSRARPGRDDPAGSHVGSHPSGQHGSDANEPGRGKQGQGPRPD
jgi:ribosomal protein S18 acetylase RimI-like enzyme